MGKAAKSYIKSAAHVCIPETATRDISFIRSRFHSRHVVLSKEFQAVLLGRIGQGRSATAMSWGCSCSLFCSAPNTAGRNPNTLVLVGSLHAKHCRLRVASRLVATIALPLYTDRGCRKLHMSARRVT